MSEKHLNDLIKYRISRANETYKEAELMKKEKHFNTCVNRLYYACFYAVVALLEKNGYGSSKHSGVRSQFNQHFVKTNKVSIENGKLYNRLFDARQEGDYIDFVYFDDKTVEPWLQQVKNFIKIISKLVYE